MVKVPTLPLDDSSTTRNPLKKLLAVQRWLVHLQVEIWVLSLQTFGLSCLQEVVVGCDKSERGQLVVYQIAVETQCAGQVYGIVAAQSVASGQFNGLVHAMGRYRDQLISFLRISRQLGSHLLILSLGDESAPQLAGKGSGNLYPAEIYSDDSSSRAVASRLNPGRTYFGQISLNKGAAVEIVGSAYHLAHGRLSLSSTIISLAGLPPAWMGVHRRFSRSARYCATSSGSGPTAPT